MWVCAEVEGSQCRTPQRKAVCSSEKTAVVWKSCLSSQVEVTQLFESCLQQACSCSCHAWKSSLRTSEVFLKARVYVMPGESLNPGAIVCSSHAWKSCLGSHPVIESCSTEGARTYPWSPGASNMQIVVDVVVTES